MLDINIWVSRDHMKLIRAINNHSHVSEQHSNLVTFPQFRTQLYISRPQVLLHMNFAKSIYVVYICFKQHWTYTIFLNFRCL